MARNLSSQKHRQKDWDVFIPAALLAFRTSLSETMGESPFYLLYEREPLLPMDISLSPPTDAASSIAEHRRRIVKQIELAQQLARENIMRTQQKMEAYYDKRAADPDFIEGQKVWVFTSKTYKGLSKKLLHNYRGPYRVVEKLSPVHCRLRTCSNKPVSSIVHANCMKHFVDRDQRLIDPLTAPVKETPFLPKTIFPQIVSTPRRDLGIQSRMKNQIILQRNNSRPLKITQILNQPK